MGKETSKGMLVQAIAMWNWSGPGKGISYIVVRARGMRSMVLHIACNEKFPNLQRKLAHEGRVCASHLNNIINRRHVVRFDVNSFVFNGLLKG